MRVNGDSVKRHILLRVYVGFRRFVDAAQDQDAEDQVNIPSANYLKLMVSQRGTSRVCVLCQREMVLMVGRA